LVVNVRLGGARLAFIQQDLRKADLFQREVGRIGFGQQPGKQQPGFKDVSGCGLLFSKPQGKLQVSEGGHTVVEVLM
jgi:hypothetical protein